jgi:hypothetical protein
MCVSIHPGKKAIPRTSLQVAARQGVGSTGTLVGKETAARLVGALVLLRQETADIRTDRDAWRTQVERLTRNERLSWWKRLAG